MTISKPLVVQNTQTDEKTNINSITFDNIQKLVQLIEQSDENQPNSNTTTSVKKSMIIKIDLSRTRWIHLIILHTIKKSTLKDDIVEQMYDEKLRIEREHPKCKTSI